MCPCPLLITDSPLGYADRLFQALRFVHRVWAGYTQCRLLGAKGVFTAALNLLLGLLVLFIACLQTGLLQLSLRCHKKCYRHKRHHLLPVLTDGKHTCYVADGICLQP